MTIKQLSIFVENKPGAMYSMTKVLSDNGVNMKALSMAETKDFGIVRIIVDDLYKATTILKEAEYVHTLTPVLAVAIPDTPGGLNKVLEVLYEANTTVEYMYAFLGGKSTDSAYMIFRVADTAAAAAALSVQGIKTVCQDEIAKL
ncbi:MAG: acetolactate synthase [Eubacterium sp.]|nr:acetolactate synthase [Eubacterium sp.]